MGQIKPVLLIRIRTFYAGSGIFVPDSAFYKFLNKTKLGFFFLNKIVDFFVVDKN
jgi:hypothetical protein